MVYEIISNGSHSFEGAASAISSSFAQLTGDLGMAAADLVIMKNFKNNRGILRMNYKAADRAKTALAMIKSIGQNKAVVRSVNVSGILKKARAKLKG